MTVETLLEEMVGLTKEDTPTVIAGLKGEDGQWVEDAPSRVKSLLAEHIKTIGDQQRNRGIREKGSGYDKLLHSRFSEVFEDLPNAKDSELIDAVLERVAAQKTKISELSVKTDDGVTMDEFLKRPEVKEFISNKVREGTKQYQDQLEEFKTKYAAKEQEIKQQDMLRRLHSLVDGYVKENNVVVDIEGDALRSKIRKQTLYGVVNLNDFSVDENGQIIVVDSNGNRAYDEDTHTAVSFAAYMDRRNPFPTKKFNTSPTSTPNTTGGNGGGGNFTYRYANAKEYMKAREKEEDPAKRKQMSADWLASQQS